MRSPFVFASVSSPTDCASAGFLATAGARGTTPRTHSHHDAASRPRQFAGYTLYIHGGGRCHS